MAQNVDDEEDAWSDCEAADAPLPVAAVTDPTRTFDDARAALAFDVGNGFDLAALARARRVDFYGAVKLLNFARAAVAAAAPFDAAAAARLAADVGEGDAWRADAYLKPVLEPDELLHRLEDVLELEGDGESAEASKLREELAVIALKTAKLAAALRETGADFPAGPPAPAVDSAAPVEARLAAELDVARARLAHLEALE